MAAFRFVHFLPHLPTVPEALAAFLRAMVVALFLLTFILQPFLIPSESMEHTLLVGDFLLVNKQIFAPAGPLTRWLMPYRDIERGDIVVFHHPRPPLLVKRVVGLPGDRIRDYLDIQPAVSGQPVDVHGNQVGALKLSKCFASSAMTCSTCHNVHQTQEDAAAYSHNCLECHKMQTCGKFRTLGQAIRTRCVDCHMPIGDSNKIVSTTGGQTLQARMRTHQIAIYPDASALVEQTIKPR